MSDDVQLSVPLPLDGDGFLRRECPTCEREFKWLPSPDETEGEDAGAAAVEPTEAPESYYCPYCGVTAPPEAWLTKAQVAVVQEVVRREFIDPGLDKLGRELEGLNRNSGGLFGIEMRLQRDEPEPAPKLDETDDMRRVDFTCHPAEPVKVLDDWERPVRCLLCGEPATP
jgi:DNA-directed RNA polymerase subunit RPC12/RpoP